MRQGAMAMSRRKGEVLFAALMLALAATGVLASRHRTRNEDGGAENEHSDDAPFKLDDKDLFAFQPGYYYADEVSPLVKKALEDSHISSTTSKTGWDLMWTNEHSDEESLVGIKSSQRVNHIPGNMFLTKKVPLLAHLQALSGRFPGEFDVFPTTYVFPEQKQKFQDSIYAKIKDDEQLLYREVGNSIEPRWIVKTPGHRGVRVVLKKSALEAAMAATAEQQVLLQNYVSPHLIDGYKYDLGFYVVVTSVDPLRAYVFDDILLRFCKKKYPINLDGFADPESYLLSRSQYGTEVGKPTLEAMHNGHNYQTMFEFYAKHTDVGGRIVMDRIFDRIRKALLAPSQTIAARLRQLQPGSNSFFELLRFDFVLDAKLKPWLTEVNLSPSLEIEHEKEEKLKRTLVDDTLRLVGATVAYKKDAASVIDRLFTDVSERQYSPDHCRSDVCSGCPTDSRCVLCPRCLSSRSKYLAKEMLLEHHRKGRHFSLIYPTIQSVMRSSMPPMVTKTRFDPVTGLPEDISEEVSEDDEATTTFNDMFAAELTDFSYVTYTAFLDVLYPVEPSSRQFNQSLLHALQAQIIAERLHKGPPSEAPIIGNLPSVIYESQTRIDFSGVPAKRDATGYVDPVIMRVDRLNPFLKTEGGLRLADAPVKAFKRDGIKDITFPNFIRNDVMTFPFPVPAAGTSESSGLAENDAERLRAVMDHRSADQPEISLGRQAALGPIMPDPAVPVDPLLNMKAGPLMPHPDLAPGTMQHLAKVHQMPPMPMSSEPPVPIGILTPPLTVAGDLKPASAAIPIGSLDMDVSDPYSRPDQRAFVMRTESSANHGLFSWIIGLALVGVVGALLYRAMVGKRPERSYHREYDEAESGLSSFSPSNSSIRKRTNV